MNYGIKDLPQDERPIERFLLKGEAALSDAELLAIIIRTGTRNLSALALANIIIGASSQGICGRRLPPDEGWLRSNERNYP